MVAGGLGSGGDDGRGCCEFGVSLVSLGGSRVDVGLCVLVESELVRGVCWGAGSFKGGVSVTSFGCGSTGLSRVGDVVEASGEGSPLS